METNTTQIEKIYENPKYILEIPEPTEELKEAALTEMPELITQILAPTETDFITAIKSSGMIIKDIKNPSTKMINEALNQNGLAIQFVEKPTAQQIKIALLNNPFCAEHLKGLSEEQKLLAVKQSGLVIRLFDNPSEELQLAAVTEYPSSIMFIKHPTKKVCIKALTLDGLCIEHIVNPDEELQLTAIENSVNGLAYRYISNPTPKVSEIAYEKNKSLFPFIKNPTVKIQVEAVHKDIENFKLLPEPCKEAQRVALKSFGREPHIFDNVPNIDPDILSEILTELEFKEKSDKRMRIPNNLSLPQLRLYRYFQVQKRKEILKSELKRVPWIDKRIKEIISSVSGINLSLDDVVGYKQKHIESELGTFITKHTKLARIENTVTKHNIFEHPSRYFVAYVSADKLLNLEFDKTQIVKIASALTVKLQPIVPEQYILGFIRYTNYKQEIWIDDLWIDPDLKSHEDNLKWLPQWVMSKFIREMRLRDINYIYSPIDELRKLLYGKTLNIDQILEQSYFTQSLIKSFHPLVDGKRAWVLD